MQCNDICLKKDDYFDRLLTEGERSEVEAHLGVCEKCMRDYDAEQALRTALAELPAPGMSSRFSGNAFAGARNERRNRTRRAGFLSACGAMAAALVVWVLVGLPIHNPTPTLTQDIADTLLVNETKNINLLLNTPRPLEKAMITIVLPDHIALAGYPEQRELSWQADLNAGKNLLTLPLVGTSEGVVAVIARIQYQDKQREMTFHMQVSRKNITKIPNMPGYVA